MSGVIPYSGPKVGVTAEMDTKGARHLFTGLPIKTWFEEKIPQFRNEQQRYVEIIPTDNFFKERP